MARTSSASAYCKVRYHDGVVLVIDLADCASDFTAGEDQVHRADWIIRALRHSARLLPRILRRWSGRWDELIVGADGAFSSYRIMRSRTWRAAMTAPAYGESGFEIASLAAEGTP
jgi:hypothetical protein